MANLTESPIYEPGIFQLEKSTPPLGGTPVIDNGVPSAGHANAQGLQLANRTAYLKQEVDAIESDILDLESEVVANGSATNLASDLANKTDSLKGAALVGFKQNQANTIGTTLQDKNSEFLSIKDFGGGAGGDVTAAFNNAAASGLPIIVPPGYYNLSADIQGKWIISLGAVFTGSGQAKVAAGGFWTDIDPQAGLHRLRDRVLIGAAAQANGKTDAGADKTWVGYSSGGLMTYFESRSTLASFSDNGVLAGAFASRSSDQNPAVGGPCIGVGTFARNDKAGATAWALYATAVKDNDTVNATHGFEVDVANRGAVVDISPYAITATGQTVSCWVRTGGETAESGQPVAQASAAIAIVSTASANPLAIFRKGIVFAANAIDTDSTGHSPAIVLARNQKIEWIRDGSGQKAGELRSDSTISTNRLNAVFNNNGMSLYSVSSAGVELETVRFSGNPTAANFIELRSANAAGRPSIFAQGSDTNIDLAIVGKGTGGVRLRDGANAERIQVNTTGIGFFGTAPIAKPTIIGSRAGNTALASILDQLANLGLITNSTTA